MIKYTIAHDYEDADGHPLRLYLRFTRSKRMTHVSQRGSATQFLSREEAEASLPKKGRYHVEPKARPKRKKDVLGRPASRQEVVHDSVD